MFDYCIIAKDKDINEKKQQNKAILKALIVIIVVFIKLLSGTASILPPPIEKQIIITSLYYQWKAHLTSSRCFQKLSQKTSLSKFAK
ncbi:MAG: hypothetical protein GYA02_11520 [Clostridiaceae bacterium]|nr:hypothetical protein [Clostridiaceae bacterium]